MNSRLAAILLIVTLAAACAPVDLNASVPAYDTGIDPAAWAQVPAGEFYFGQHEAVQSTGAYEIMVTDVTVEQYAAYLTAALAGGDVRPGEFKGSPAVVGYYPGDVFRGVKHEEEIKAGEWIFVPLDDPASRFTFDGTTFGAVPGYEQHPMTNVTWFGARGYCEANGWRLPTEVEWEKAARGTDGRRFPWGDKFSRDAANNDKNLLPVGSKPLGASPYDVVDMAGNVAEWTASVYAPYPKLEAALPPEFGGAAAVPAGGDAASPVVQTGQVTIAPGDPRLAMFTAEELRDTRPRVYRGGSFNSYARFLRCTSRQKEDPNARWNNIGFRCVADVGSQDRESP